MGGGDDLTEEVLLRAVQELRHARITLSEIEIEAWVEALQRRVQAAKKARRRYAVRLRSQDRQT